MKETAAWPRGSSPISERTTCSSRAASREEEPSVTSSSTAGPFGNTATRGSSRARRTGPAAPSPRPSPRTWRWATNCRKRLAARFATSRRRCGEESFRAEGGACRVTCKLSAVSCELSAFNLLEHAQARVLPYPAPGEATAGHRDVDAGRQDLDDGERAAQV